MKVNIYPHKTLPGWWTLDYRPNGAKGKRHREHHSSFEEAEEAKAILEGVPRREPIYPPLRDVITEYLMWAKANQTQATYDNKRCRVGVHILAGLGDRRVQDLSQRVLDAYGQGMNRGTYRDDIYHLLALISWMVKRHYCAPLTWKPEIPSYQQQIKHLPPIQDILRFIEALPKEQHKIACRIMLFAGLRWNETRNLRWEDYRDEQIMLQVSKTKEKEIITIPEPCKKWFEDNKGRTGYVFSADGGITHLSNLQRPLLVAGKVTGVKMTAHCFRHASATALYELTGDIYEVQHHLRHSRVTTSQIYTRYSAARRRGSVEALVGMMDKMDKDKNGDNVNDEA